MSRVLDWSSPETVSVVRPGATAVTTPVRLTRATPASAADHCRASGLTTRPPCVGTTTRSVSTSPGESRSGLGSWIAMSLGVTTIGAVAVRPVVLVTCTVPWPGASATVTPFWSTLAISGRSDFHVTATGAAGDPSSLSARGDTRVFSEGSRYTVGGSMRSTVAGPLPGGCPTNASGPVPAGGAVGGGCVGVCGVAGGAPTTCTAACPFRALTRASMIATPPATPVTVPSLSTFATATLLDDQITRTVGMTLPARSNAVASSPVRSPTLIVTDGGATWTSATFWPSAALGRANTASTTTRRGTIAAPT